MAPDRRASRRTRARGWIGFAFVRSSADAARHRRSFGDLERFCVFLGYPRSGHSVVGALIDAHPEAVIAHELDALRYVRAGFTRRQIYALLVESSRRSAQGGRRSTDGRYDYAVPHQWQGRWRRLRVLGDKRGGATTRRLVTAPHLFDALRRRVALPVSVVHVVRNPYDNIATMALRMASPSLMLAADQYFSLAAAVQRARAKVADDDWIELRHEDLIETPQMELKRVCSALDLDAPDAYLRDCDSILFRSPRRSRERIAWTPQEVNAVARRMADHPHLAGYSFDG